MVQVFRVEMRHGWSELAKWSTHIHKLEELLLLTSCDDSWFERSFVTRDEELRAGWTHLTDLLEHREVVELLSN